MARYALNPSTPVLSRPDGTVQVGWDPRRAVVIRPALGQSDSFLLGLLRTLQSAATIPQLHRFAADHDVATTVVDDLVSHLVASGVAKPAPRDHVRAAVVRVHGSGPLSDLLTASLRCANIRVSQSSRNTASTARADLVVLTDYLVADPRLVRDLHRAGAVHLPVRVRDGAGLVGPLVIPGRTSCLRCADLHRSDKDAAWPAVAAQLCHTIGSADRPTVLATAALALNEIDHVVRAARGDPAARPATMDTTLEFDVARGAVEARQWSRHRHCTC